MAKKQTSNHADPDQKRSRRLPSLKALRAFEATARHLSFTNAAKELSVSQGAISHQVRILEEELGTALFVRTKWGITLTAEGTLLKDVSCRWLDEIAEITQHIRPERQTKTLRVQAGPFFSMKVIAPRVASFMSENPGVQLHLNNIDISKATSLQRDVLIDYCLEPPANQYAIELMRERLIPIASPTLLEAGQDPTTLVKRDDISRLNYRDLSDWQNWLEKAGISDKGNHPNLIFDDQHTIVEAVKSGQGIAMADRSLVQDDIKRGRIIVISSLHVESNTSYKFICSDEQLKTNPVIALFRDWLMKEVAAFSQGSEQD